MKNKIILTNVIPRFGPFRAALAAFLLLGIAALSSLGQVLPPSSLPYGYSYEEWSAKYLRWYMGKSTNHWELVGSPGICEGPASGVRFLAHNPLDPPTNTYHVIIPAGTPLFFSVYYGYYDNTACPLSASTSYTADQLAAMAEAAYTNPPIVHFTFTIDGVPVAGLEDPINTVYHVVSTPVSYTTAEEGNVVAVIEGEPCLPGGLTVYPLEAAGVFLMLSPLSEGKHTIQVLYDTPTERTWDITVSRDQGWEHDQGGQ